MLNAQVIFSPRDLLIAGAVGLSLLASAPSAAATPASAPSGGSNNLVTNGGFEDPAIPAGQYQLLDSIPGWKNASAPTCHIELQNNVAGAPFEGKQHIELDSDCPGAISQDIDTRPQRIKKGRRGHWYNVYKSYKLCFAYTPRPEVADNHIQVKWGGKAIAELNRDGTALKDKKTDWLQICIFDLKASSKKTALEFIDTSTSDGLGGYIDAVSVQVTDPNDSDHHRMDKDWKKGN